MLAAGSVLLRSGLEVASLRSPGFHVDSYGFSVLFPIVVGSYGLQSACSLCLLAVRSVWRRCRCSHDPTPDILDMAYHRSTSFLLDDICRRQSAASSIDAYLPLDPVM